jgi:hypothetical protein
MSKLNHFLEEEKDFQKMFNIWKQNNSIRKDSQNDSQNINLIYETDNDFNNLFTSWNNKIEKIKNKNKRIVYTAIINNYDGVQEPNIITEDWEYICFTDTPTHIFSKTWKIIDIHSYPKLKDIKNKTLLARIIKWSPTFLFSDIETSIWVDANMIINVNLNTFLNSLPNDYPIILTEHPNRSCIYQEILAIKSRIERNIVKENLNGVNNWTLDLQYKLKYPPNNGLCQTGLKIHNHNYLTELENIGNLIRKIMNDYSIIRDQLIFNFVCYRLNIPILNLSQLPSIDNKHKNNFNFYLNNHKK